ncbi:aldo/keto reductase [Stackebrandtia albiflava]|nr:aldo/keto reductase [Stackebrandtia albiflava]
MPALGLGTYPMANDEAHTAVMSAIASGYRLIDTATRYGNEPGVGQAIRDSGVPRGELFVVTKLPGADHGYDETLASFEAARNRLGTDYVDLYLIHWPLPRLYKYVDSFRAMSRLRDDGLVRSVGVSNFGAKHLRRLVEETGTVPVVNQVELHPRFNQAEMREVHRSMDIVTQAWSPLGRGDVLDDPTIVRVADRHSVTPAQVVLRWEVQLGVVPIPKSRDPHRQRLNLDVWDFVLDEDEVVELSALETGRQGGDPDVHEEF